MRDERNACTPRGRGAFGGGVASYGWDVALEDIVGHERSAAMVALRAKWRMYPCATVERSRPNAMATREALARLC